MWTAAAVILLVASYSFAIGRAEEGKAFTEEGRILRPETTRDLVHLIRDPELAREFSGKSEAFKKLVEVLPEKAQHELADYDRAVASHDPEAIRRAEEALHKRFWETMKESDVQAALHGHTAGEVAHEFGGILTEASDRLRSSNRALSDQIRASANHMAEAQRTARQRLDALHAADKFMEPDSHMKDPSFGRLVESMIHGDNPPTAEALDAFTRLLGDAYTATSERGLNGNGPLSPEMMTKFRHQAEYDAWATTPNKMQERFEVLGSVLRGEGAAEALKGHEALFFEPMKTVRDKMIEKARQLHLLDGLKEEMRKELKQALGREPTEQEILDHLSLRDMEDVICAKMNQTQKDAFLKELDDAHVKALAESMKKILEADPEGAEAKAEALKELFRKPKPEDRPRRFGCVGDKALSAVGTPAFLAAAALILPLSGPNKDKNAKMLAQLRAVNQFAAGQAPAIIETPANLRSRSGHPSSSGPATHDGNGVNSDPLGD